MQESPANPSSETESERSRFVNAAQSAEGDMPADPVYVRTLTSNLGDIIAGDIGIPVADGEISGYRAQPGSKGPFPIVLIACEVFGLQEHIKDICRRFSREGYLAIAPDFFCRQGDVSKLESFEEVFKIVSRVPDARVMSDLDAAVEWAAKNKGDARRIGVTGFCWGGRVTWLYAAHSAKAKAGTAWYGRLVADTTELQPQNPIDIVPELKAPVLGLYGGQDPGIPLDTVEKMREALKKAGNPSQIVVYPEAPHGFFADIRPSYRKEAAEDGWKRLLTWFRKYGAA
jgi:carboxymethylenebutenolidase